MENTQRNPEDGIDKDIWPKRVKHKLNFMLKNNFSIVKGNDENMVERGNSNNCWIKRTCDKLKRYMMNVEFGNPLWMF